MIKHFGGSATASLIIAVTGFLFVPFQLRLVGVESFGLIGLFAVINAWAQFLQLGAGPTINRELASFKARGTGSIEAAAVYSGFITILVVIGMIIFSSFAVLGGLIQTERIEISSGVTPGYLLVVGILIPLMILENYQLNAILGLQKFNMAIAVRLVLGVGKPTLATFALYFYHDSVIPYFVAHVILILASLIFTYRLVGESVDLKLHGLRKFEFRAVQSKLKFSLNMAAAAVGGAVLLYTDRFFAFKSLSATDWGIYSVAWTVGSAILMLVMSLASIALPKISVLSSANDYDGLRELLIKFYMLSAITIGTFSSSLFFFPNWFVQLWLGPGVDVASTASTISAVAAGAYFYGVSQFPQLVSIAEGKTSKILQSNTAFGCLLVVCYLFLPSSQVEDFAEIFFLFMLFHLLVSSVFLYKFSTLTWKYSLLIVAAIAPFVIGALVSSGLQGMSRSLDSIHLVVNFLIYGAVVCSILIVFFALLFRLDCMSVQIEQ